MMPLVVRKNPGETWRETVVRYARPQGLETECLAEFDFEMSRGDHVDGAQAAFDALYEWDCLAYEAEA